MAGATLRILTEPNERRAIAVKEFADGRVIDVVVNYPRHVLIAETRADEIGWGVYDNVWQYQSTEAAIDALSAWDGTAEPQGWYRHYNTNRRRPGGDPAKEYIRE
jgi:hypothetical protein